MGVDEAFSLIAHALDAGSVAHGYLVVGEVDGSCAELVRRVLHRVFPGQESAVDEGTHPDVFRLAPIGRSRTIKIRRGKDDDGPGMQDGLIAPMSVSSFSGGWKVGVIVSADRLQEEAANAFLKTLEEPPPKTFFLLLTDRPDGILPTIVSRTQRIDLGRGSEAFEGEEAEAIADAFQAKDAAALVAVFKELKEAADDAEVPQVRKRFFCTLMGFVRALMISGKVPRHVAFRNVEAVEDAYRQSNEYLSDDLVLSYLLDRIVLPAS